MRQWQLLSWMMLVFLLAMVSQAATYPISYRLTQAGNVSVNVYDANGLVVRELLRARAQTAGEHTIFWDGLDRDGNGVPAGSYSWKLLQTDGLSSRFLLSLGSNYPIGTDWRNACGPGTHGSPFGVAVDESGIYISANTTENIETCSLKLSPDGKTRLWSALHPKAWDGALSLATDGGQLFMLGHTASTDGRITLPKRQLVYVYDATTGVLAANMVVPTGVGNVPDKIDVHWDPANQDIDASDMDVYDGVLAVTYAKRNTLRWYDSKSGEKLDTAEVDSPEGVTVGPKGIVYVSTGDRIVTLTREDKTPKIFATGLTKPGRLDIDHSSGELLVYQAGSSQQIVRLSAAGTTLQTYGVVGGRPQGLYTAETKKSFDGFADLCADGAGGMYITEMSSAPRRVAHLNGAGAVLREWYGGQRWAPHAAPEPDNPNAVWVGSQYGWIMRVIVDYAKKTWTVHSCYNYTSLANGLVGDSWNEGGYFHAYQHNGVTYLALEKSPTILKFDEKSGKLLPVTVCGNVGNSPQFMKDWAAGNNSYQWNDGNGDGLPQQEEVTFYKDGMPGSLQPTIDAQFTAFMPSDKVRTYAVTSWNDFGAPIYGTMPAGEIYADYPARFGGGFYNDSRWSAFLYHDVASGRLYGALNNGTTGWCSSVDSVMQQWDAKKALKWGVSEQGPNLGQIFYNLRGIAGVTHDCVVAIDVDGGWNMANLARTYVWDKDGLFVGGIMDNPDLNDIPKFMYQNGGELCHSSLYTLPNGDVYFYANWENEMRVYQVTGWDKWTRKTGALKVVAASKAQLGTGLHATYFSKPAFDGTKTERVDGTFTTTTAASAHWRGMITPSYGPAYSGGWGYQNDKDAYEGGLHACRDNQCRMSWVFKGTSVVLRGRTGPNYGYAKIYIDGEMKQQVDYYSPELTNNVTIFMQTDLAVGNHLLEVEVIGWYAPRNPKSTDGWVTVDKLIADDIGQDDNGIPYTFTAKTEGLVQVWLNKASIINDGNGKAITGTNDSKPIKLLRMPYPLQVSYVKGVGVGKLALLWSYPLATLQPIPVSALFPDTLYEAFLE